MQQGRTFDAVAELYERVRPGYPEALFDDLTGLAGLGADARILEIGCGTGKATRGWVSRGFSVLALEPGAAMLRVAESQFSRVANVEFLETTFEAWPERPGAFDLVAAAQCFHWLDPAVAFSKTSRVLKPGGSLAVFGNVPLPFEPKLADALRAVYREHAPHLEATVPERWYAEHDVMSQRFEGSGCFEPPTRRAYPWSREHGAESYTSLLRTQSAHLLLPPEAREALLAGLARVVESSGGRIKVGYEAELYLARRLA